MNSLLAMEDCLSTGHVYYFHCHHDIKQTDKNNEHDKYIIFISLLFSLIAFAPHFMLQSLV